MADWNTQYRDLNKHKHAKHSHARQELVKLIEAADKNIEEVRYLVLAYVRTTGSPSMLYPSPLATQQAKQGVLDNFQKKSTANVNEENEKKISDLKKQHKAAVKALKQAHKREVGNLQKTLQAWENGVSAFSSLLYMP